MITTNMALIHNKGLLNTNILYVLDPQGDPQLPQTNTQSNKSLFHFNKSTQTNYNTYIMPNAAFIKKLGICTAVAGTCIAFYAALQTVTN
jgi:hypothetical protein